MIFRRVPLVSQEPGRRDHQIVVPFNTALTLVIYPSFYTVNAASGVALSKVVSTKLPLLVPPGQQVTPINLTITGVTN